MNSFTSDESLNLKCNKIELELMKEDYISNLRNQYLASISNPENSFSVPATLLKKTWTQVFPYNFVKFLRNAFL